MIYIYYHNMYIYIYIYICYHNIYIILLMYIYICMYICCEYIYIAIYVYTHTVGVLYIYVFSSVPYCHQFLKIRFLCYGIVSSFDCNGDWRILGCSFEPSRNRMVMLVMFDFAIPHFADSRILTCFQPMLLLPCLINVAGTRPETEQASTNHQPQETTQPRNELCVVNSATRPPGCNFSRWKKVVAPGRSTWEAVGSCSAWRLRWFFRDSQDQALWISCHIQDLPRISRSWDQPLQELHGTGVAVTPVSRCPGSMLINMWTTRSSAWHRNVLQNAFYVTFRCFQNMLWALWPSTDERISSGQWRLSRATVDIRATWLRMVHEWWVRNEL